MIDFSMYRIVYNQKSVTWITVKMFPIFYSKYFADCLIHSGRNDLSIRPFEKIYFLCWIKISIAFYYLNDSYCFKIWIQERNLRYRTSSRESWSFYELKTLISKEFSFQRPSSTHIYYSVCIWVLCSEYRHKLNVTRYPPCCTHKVYV